MTPDEIALNLGKDYIQLLPLQKINQFLSLNRYGTLDLLRAKHLRVAQWLLNVFLLLLAISTVLTREPGRLKSATFKCLLLTGLCMGSVFVTYQMAASPPRLQILNLWPALMAWVPIFIFGPLSVYLMSRVKTENGEDGLWRSKERRASVMRTTWPREGQLSATGFGSEKNYQDICPVEC